MAGDFPSLNVSGLTWAGGPLDLQQYLGLWAIEETFFHQQWDMILRMNLAAHLASRTPEMVAAQSAAKTKTIQQADAAANGIQIIEIRGTMTKQGSSLSDAGSTVRIKEAMRQAAKNPDVGGAFVIFDTPGGTVAGTGELADEYYALSQQKPTISFVEDLMASAGLFVGAQGGKVYANADNAIVGSMGVFIGLYDFSGYAAKEGIKPVVIKTGELKGAGFAGTEISEAQKQMWQALADESFVAFQNAVTRTRKLSADQLKEISRAGVYPARQAIGLGLIDGVRSFDAAMAELRGMVSSKRKGGKMSTDSDKPQVATLDQLEAACRGASPDFLLAQLRAGATVTLAQSAWMGALNAQITDLNKQLAESKTAMETLKASHKTELDSANAKVTDLETKLKSKGAFSAVNTLPGANGGAGAEQQGSATQQWNSAKDALVKSGMTVQEAVMHLTSKNQDLHKAYLAEVNANRS